MPKRKKQPRTKPRFTPFLANARRIILALGGIGGVIVIVLAVIPILQTERDAITQDVANTTQVAIWQDQLSVLREIATLQAQPGITNEDIAPTATAMAQQLAVSERIRQALGPNPTHVPDVTLAPVNLLDIVMLFDTSGSLSVNSARFQAAALNVINEIEVANSRNRIGLVTFSTGAETIYSLGGNFNHARFLVANVVYQETQGSSATFTGLDKAYDLLNSEKRQDARGVVILFTDGVADDSTRDDSQMLTVNIARLMKSSGVVIAAVASSEPNPDTIPFLSDVISSNPAFIMNVTNLNARVLIKLIAGQSQ